LAAGEQTLDNAQLRTIFGVYHHRSAGGNRSRRQECGICKILSGAKAEPLL
jgi:hypothetical protein